MNWHKTADEYLCAAGLLLTLGACLSPTTQYAMLATGILGFIAVIGSLWFGFKVVAAIRFTKIHAVLTLTTEKKEYRPGQAVNVTLALSAYQSFHLEQGEPGWLGKRNRRVRQAKSGPRSGFGLGSA